MAPYLLGSNTSFVPRPQLFDTIVLGGLAVGVLDGLAATINRWSQRDQSHSGLSVHIERFAWTCFFRPRVHNRSARRITPFPYRIHCRSSLLPAQPQLPSTNLDLPMEENQLAPEK